MDRLEAIFLGTNGWYDTSTGDTTCVLLKTGKTHIILDAGNGIYKADRYIDPGEEVNLFLSHFHIDHICGLHILNKLQFGSLRIFGQPGTVRILDTIINHPYTLPLSDLPFPVTVQEIPEGSFYDPVPMECRFLVHASPCMGYRFKLDGKIVAYIPDTGICENAVRLAEGADLMIAECSFRPGERNAEWPHLNPEDAGEIARMACARRLVLVHFDASRYITLEERLKAVRCAGFSDVMAATDEMVLMV